MGKKKKLGTPREAYNPYFGKAKDESQMAKKPFFTDKDPFSSRSMQ